MNSDSNSNNSNANNNVRAPVNWRNRYPPNSFLFDAIRDNDLDLAQYAINRDATVVNQTDYTDRNRTNLQLAVEIGTPEMINFLLTNGANVNGTNTFGITALHLKNRWATISREERLPHMAAWWRALPKVLPFPEWRTAWDRVVPAAPSLQRGRKAITAWLYAAEKAMCAALKEDLPHGSFSGLCAELSTFSSGCGKRSKRAKTCRSKNQQPVNRSRFGVPGNTKRLEDFCNI